MDRIISIVKKEFIDLTRDRRTMFFMFIFPAIIIPLLFTAIPTFIKSLASKEMDKTLTIAVVGKEFDMELMDFLEKQEKLTVLTNFKENELEKQISDEILDGALVIPSNANYNLEKNIPIEIKLYFRSSKGENFEEKRINSILETFFEPIINKRYESFRIVKETFIPYRVKKVDIASDREKFGKTIGTFLPYMFLIFCFSGAMYPALDLGAGEKERGTLETILTSPASQIEILCGKFIVVSSFGVLSVVFGLLGLLAAVKINADIPAEMINVAMNILGLKPVILMLSLLIPIALFFGALLLAVSFYAKTYKEAQSIMGPLNFMIIIPILIGTFPGIVLDPMTAWIPILNVSLAMNDIIAGTITFPLYVEVFLSLLIFTILSIFIAIRFVSREDVIFRG